MSDTVRRVLTTLVIIGCIVLYRSIRRPVDEDGGDGWRVGQGIVVMICGVLMALMIPLFRCPPGTTLSPVFRFCTNREVAFPAPDPGLPWKVAAFAAGIAIGVLLIRWRSMPIWLATAIVIAACLGTTLFILWRTTGIPGFGSYAPGLVLVTQRLSGGGSGRQPRRLVASSVDRDERLDEVGRRDDRAGVRLDLFA